MNAPSTGVVARSNLRRALCKGNSRHHLLRRDAIATGTSTRRALLSRSLRNSPAKSNGGLVKNNEIYKPGSFRVQRQRPAPRAAENNNEFQAENKGRGHEQEHLCGSRIPIAQRHRTKTKPRRGLPPGAHFVSFNFTNTTIRRVPSTSATDVGKKRRAKSVA
jgi:hypothetical protein